MAEDWVGLADAIRALRRELTAAMTAGEGEPIRLELSPVEMEFLLEVGKEGRGAVLGGVAGRQGLGHLGVDPPGHAVAGSQGPGGSATGDRRRRMNPLRHSV